MTRLLVSLLVGLVIMPAAFAAEGQKLQRARGGFVQGGTAGANTEITQVSGSAEIVTGLAVKCGASACGVSLYDEDAVTSADLLTNAKGRAEASAAANTTAYLDFSDRPIRFASGIAAYLNGTDNGAVVYTEQLTP